MSNLGKLDVVVLDVSDKNYLTLASDVKMHLRSNELLSIIDAFETTSDESKA